MKKILPVLVGLLCLPAYAEVAPVGYWDEEVATEEIVNDDEGQNTDSSAQTNLITPATNLSPRAGAARSGTTSRTAVVRSGGAGVRSVTPRAVSNRASSSIRSMANTNSRQNVSPRTATNNVNTARAATTSLVQTNTVTQPLYNSSDTARVGVTTRGSGIGSVAASRVASISGTTTTADSGVSLDQLAQLTDFCRAQYTSCMDNFCNVLDDNQGRCSCSADINNYIKVEDALKQATMDLQSVAQQIRYLGLTADEVKSLFAQTEAEAAMSGVTDTTELNNDLVLIEKMITDVKTSSATSSASSGFTFDFSNLDLNFGGDFDFSSLFGDTSGTALNQRGAELYNTAVARCKSSVLDSCKAQGVDTSLVSNSYDLEIDKQCITYQRALDDSNTQMKRTVMNAQAFLQQARLSVAQKRNTYDTMQKCVSALDTCMQNDFVCGSDYDGCLDPTGKYIVNGQIVNSTNSADITTGLENAWGNAWTAGLSSFIEAEQGSFDNTNMVGYLENKIGNIATGGAETGMCMNVLKQCQNYTFTGTNKTYNPRNGVVREYLMRTLSAIKARQDTLVADYVGSCRSDVQSCLITNGAIIGDSGLNTGWASNSIVNACNSVATTCAGASGATSAAALIKDIVCYDPSLSASSGGYCGCPTGTTWSNSSKMCVCPSGKTWNYDTGACE
ncbi:MAG: hypothetical protein LBL75_03545 [Rickettsiales bacterium]|jgi:hypothetical protein|nr:hypothetical protein [Rickettsiales bacterium]